MPSRLENETAPRILVHMPNWLGDAIMTTPLLSLLTRAFAAVADHQRPSLHLAIRQPWSVLFSGDAAVSNILPIDRGGRHAGLAGLWRQATEMKNGGYDAVVLGPPSLRAGLTACLARIPRRIGYATDGRGLCLNPGLAPGPRGSRHYSYEMLGLGLSLLEDLGIEAPLIPSEGLPISQLPGCDEFEAVELGDERPLWIVAPGTTYGEAKTWPLARVTEFVEVATAEGGARVVLLGDGGAGEFVAAMRKNSSLSWSQDLGTDSQVVDLAGRTDLKQVVQVLKAAAAFIGNDSGLMHLAGALGRPTVGIFGSSNPEWTHPLGAHTAAVVADGFDCRPCYRKTCNESLFCLATISASAVYEQVCELLAAAKERRLGN